mgnify:CR=1 FL=1
MPVTASTRPSRRKDQPEPPAGISCPVCGGPHMPVKCTRQKPGCTERIRKCTACGQRIMTRETYTARVSLTSV